MLDAAATQPNSKPIVMVLTLFFWAGCSGEDPLDRQAITGTIKVAGQPLSAGAILLEPISAQAGTAVGAIIHDGAFVIVRKDGPVPGSYRVRIYASSRVQAPAPKGSSERKPRPMVELIAEKYNSKTELSAEIVSGESKPLSYDLKPDPE